MSGQIELNLKSRLVPGGAYRLRRRATPDGGVRYTFRPWLAAVVPLVFFGAFVFVAIELWRTGSAVRLNSPLAYVVVGLAFMPLLIGIRLLLASRTAIINVDGSARLKFNTVFRRRTIDIPPERARLDVCEYEHRDNAILSFIVNPLRHIVVGARVYRYCGLVLHDGADAMLIGLADTEKGENKLRGIAEELSAMCGLRGSNATVRVLSK